MSFPCLVSAFARGLPSSVYVTGGTSGFLGPGGNCDASCAELAKLSPILEKLPCCGRDHIRSGHRAAVCMQILAHLSFGLKMILKCFGGSLESEAENSALLIVCGLVGGEIDPMSPAPSTNTAIMKAAQPHRLTSGKWRNV